MRAQQSSRQRTVAPTLHTHRTERVLTLLHAPGPAVQAATSQKEGNAAVEEKADLGDGQEPDFNVQRDKPERESGTDIWALLVSTAVSPLRLYLPEAFGELSSSGVHSEAGCEQLVAGALSVLEKLPALCPAHEERTTLPSLLTLVLSLMEKVGDFRAMPEEKSIAILGNQGLRLLCSLCAAISASDSLSSKNGGCGLMLLKCAAMTCAHRVASARTEVASLWLRAYAGIVRAMGVSNPAPAAVDQLVCHVASNAATPILRVQILKVLLLGGDAPRLAPFLLGFLYDASQHADPAVGVETVKTWTVIFSQVPAEQQAPLLAVLVPVVVAILPSAKSEVHAALVSALMHFATTAAAAFKPVVQSLPERHSEVLKGAMRGVQARASGRKAVSKSPMKLDLSGYS